jgi:DcmR-like sensory protein
VRTGAADHGVHVYLELDELVASVRAFEPDLVVATPEHARAFGLRCEHADAEETLAAFMDGGRPSAASFLRVVGGLVDSVAARHPERHIRVYGEMVDVLVKRGELRAAIELEVLWNDLLERRRNVSLLCAYELDVFDGDVQRRTLPHVCHVHSAVKPADDPQRLAHAVERALDEVLGPDDAAKVYVLVEADPRRNHIPAGQLALMWVSANMPLLAERILARARSNYRSEPLAASA